MIDLKKEDGLSASELSVKLMEEIGVERSRFTIHDWMTRGVRGIVMESRMIGGDRMTSYEAWLRFDAKLNEGKK